MEPTLTDRAFWKQYWADKDVQIEIGPRYLFHEIFQQLCRQQTIGNAIEIGGFPGYFSIYLAKYLGVDVTLLDFFIDRNKVRQLAEVNHLPLERLTLIEHDFLQYESNQTYDLVFSCGLLEHFQNVDELIDRHVRLLSPGGQLFIEIPNFRGLNGWIQRTWDRENLEKHNLDCMHLKRLRGIMADQPLRRVKVHYHGRYGAWLERREERPPHVRTMFNTVNFLGRKISRLVPFENRSFSPYIVMTGVREDSRQISQPNRFAA